MAKGIKPPASRQGATSLQLVRIGRRQFVVGIFWQDVGRHAMRDARQIGQRDKFDLAVIRQAGINSAQAGFITSGRGIRAGLHSMAAALAHRLGRNFVGIFAVPGDSSNRYVLCAVRDGHVMPGFDRIGSLPEMTQAFQEALMLSASWDAVFVPENIPLSTLLPESLTEQIQTQTRDLGKLFALRPPAGATRLKPLKIQMSGGTWLLIIGMCVGAGVWYGWIPVNVDAYLPAWLTSLTSAKPDTAAPQRAATPSTVPAPQTEPWTSQIALKPFLEACTGAIHALPVQIKGWLFEEAQCKQTAPAQLTLSVRYKRQSGTVKQFLEAVRDQDGNPGFSENFDVATLSVPLPVEKSSGTETLLPQAQRLASFASNLQALGISFKLNPTSASTSPPTAMPGTAGGQAPSTPPTPAWQTSQWSFETRMAPLSVLAALDSAGIRISTLKIRLRAASNPSASQATTDLTLPLNWTVEGLLYAQ